MENTVEKIRTKPKPSVIAVIGGAWGDEGKGKIASREAKEALLVIRATGGANAGHTVVFEGKKIALHLVPGGIVYPHTICLIGQGVVIDLEVLIKEIEQLEKIGIPNVRERLKISGRAHVVLPYHKELDELHEMIKDNPIGTTKRGIGPAYSDKDNRIGIRVYDLLGFEHLESKISQAIKLHNALFRSFGFSVVNDRSDKLAEKMYNYGKVIEPIEEWGKKKLAYEIKHMQDGYYYFIQFEGEKTTPKNVEEFVRIMESVIRYLIVKKGDEEEKKVEALTEPEQVTEENQE